MGKRKRKLLVRSINTLAHRTSFLLLTNPSYRFPTSKVYLKLPVYCFNIYSHGDFYRLWNDRYNPKHRTIFLAWTTTFA
jgi:hypothetical protein